MAKHQRYEKKTPEGQMRFWEVWTSYRTMTVRTGGKGLRAKQEFTTWPTIPAAHAEALRRMKEKEAEGWQAMLQENGMPIVRRARNVWMTSKDGSVWPPYP